MNSNIRKPQTIFEYFRQLVSDFPQSIRAYMLMGALVLCVVYALFRTSQSVVSINSVVICVFAILALLFITWMIKIEIDRMRPKVYWSRKLPALPFPNDRSFSIISEKLLDLHNAIAQYIHQEIPEVNENQIRSNLFYADYNDAEFGDACSLRIKIRNNMVDQDSEIAFRPNEGSTGACFATNRQKIITKVDESNIFLHNSSKVGRNLSWIITFPVLSKEKTKLKPITPIMWMRSQKLWIHTPKSQFQ